MTHSHHSHAPHGSHDRLGPAGIDRTLWIAVGCCALITLIGLIVLWPSGAVPTSMDTSTLNGNRVEAVVASTTSAPCSYDPLNDCRVVTIQLTSGPNKGTESTWEQGPDSGTPTVHADDDIYVYQTVRADGTVSYEFADFERSTPLLALGLIFVGAVLLLARWKGLGAIGGLAASLLVLVVFMLPAILRGENAIAVALVGSSVIAFIALYLAHGMNISTTVALLSTFLSLAVIGLLSWIFVTASQFSGRTEESTYFLTALGVQIDARGLLLAGIVIGSLGVLDDVTVTQVSAVWELRQAQPDASRREIYQSAVNIGRDHISSTVNTLFLTYAGAALPLLLLFAVANQSITSVLTGEIVATELVRSLVGSIGLVASVPIATWMASTVLSMPHGREDANGSGLSEGQPGSAT